MPCKYCNNTGYIDNIFIVGDLRQAEAMVVAELLKRTGYPKLWELFQDPNFDVHRWAAAPIFNTKEEDVTKYQREIGKLSNHSGNYGAGPSVLVNKALKDGIKDVNYQFAKHILDQRYKQLPGLKKWWEDVECKIRTTRVLTTCFGRRRLFFGRLDDSTFRDGYSYEPQSTVGDVCNQIFWKLRERFRNHLLLRRFEPLSTICRADQVAVRSTNNTEAWTSFPDWLRPIALIQVHDEVVTRCPNIPEIVDYTIQAYKDAANIPLHINEDKPLVIPIELKIGKNWKDTKEIE
jgi:DNA polymerase I-like protein with 3'-5' exonuclease and polymerase domains